MCGRINPTKRTSTPSRHRLIASVSTSITSRRGQTYAECFIESFNGRLLDELLNETPFMSLASARVILERLASRPQRITLVLQSPDGRRRPNSTSPSFGGGIWRWRAPDAAAPNPQQSNPNARSELSA
jgi:hypothetical protein